MVKNNTTSTLPKYTTDEIRRYTSALPTILTDKHTDERITQATRSALTRLDASWEQRLKSQIAQVTKEVTPQLDYDSQSGRYAVTAVELRGIIAKITARAWAQCALDIGQALAAPDVLGDQFSTAKLDTETVDLTITTEGLEANYRFWW